MAPSRLAPALLLRRVVVGLALAAVVVSSLGMPRPGTGLPRTGAGCSACGRPDCTCGPGCRCARGCRRAAPAVQPPKASCCARSTGSSAAAGEAWSVRAAISSALCGASGLPDTLDLEQGPVPPLATAWRFVPTPGRTAIPSGPRYVAATFAPPEPVPRSA